MWYPGPVDAHRAVQAKIEQAARSGADLVTLWRAVGPLLAEAVPHFEAPCFFTVDPSSLLATSHFQEGLPEIPAEWLGREYAEPDYNSMTDVLRSPTGVGTLHEATGNRPELSTKFHEEMAPFGCDQELLVALRTRDQQAWGLVGLYREVGRPRFSGDEITLLRSIAPALAEGARRGLLLGQAREPDLPEAPGVVVLDRSLAVQSATPQAAHWLEDLGGSTDVLPVSVVAIAGHALNDDEEPAVARVRGASGRWLVVHAARLDGPGGAEQVIVIVEAAQSMHLAPLLMRAHGLTPREQDVTRVMLRGASTTVAARELGISESTVQQHLKSIFEKTGVRSRGELVRTIFHTHYEPRVRDNERRTTDDRPSRDGPMPMKKGP